MRAERTGKLNIIERTRQLFATGMDLRGAAEKARAEARPPDPATIAAKAARKASLKALRRLVGDLTDFDPSYLSGKEVRMLRHELFVTLARLDAWR